MSLTQEQSKQHRDRMTKVTVSSSNYEFRYDELGRMLWRKTFAATELKHYYDGIRDVMMKDKPSGGSWSTYVTYVLGKGATGFIIGFDADGTKRFYHYDRLGNVMNRSDASGDVSDTYDQDAFGNVLAGSSGGFHLTTKNHIADIGLYYFFQRWYDPVLGRFTSPEKLYKELYLNRYLYCENNPMNYIDPDGEAVVVIPAIGAGAAICIFGGSEAITNYKEAKWRTKACQRARKDMERNCKREPFNPVVCQLFKDNYEYQCGINQPGYPMAKLGGMYPGTSSGGPLPSTCAKIGAKGATSGIKCISDQIDRRSYRQ